MRQVVDTPGTVDEAAKASVTCARDGGEPGPADLLGLGRTATLGFVVARRRRAVLAAAEEMAGVCHWADLHRLPTPPPAQHDAEFGSISRDTVLLLDHPALDPEHRPWGGPDGVETSLRLFGEAAYLVAEFAVSEVAAALGMSEGAARCYVGESLETRDRLPRLWRRVMAGELEGWKARRIARMTIPLNAEAAAFVDLSLHRVAHRIGVVRIERVVDAAVLRFDPDAAAERAAAAAERRGVWVEDELDGTSTITARADTPDVEAFEQALTDVAKALGVLGDEDPFEVRRARAVGILADPAYAVDLHATAEAAPAPAGTTPSTGDAGDGRPRRRVRRSTHGPQVHLHLHLTEGSDAGDAPIGPVARVEGPAGTGPLGPRPLAVVERWLTGLAPGAVVRLTPVVDLGADIAVDAYEVPDRIATQVEHRDLVCQFPWCSRQSRHDKDHIDPYRDPDDGGPPRQTRAANLARLCRYHHRLKTHCEGGDGWRYQRQPDDSLIWTSPHRLSYRVDRTGTRRLD